MIPFIVGGVGALVALLGYSAASKEAAKNAQIVGVCRVPSGLSAADLAALQRMITMSASPAEPCHHDLQEALDYYALNRQANGSISFTKDGTTRNFPSFQAWLAFAAQG